MKSTLAVTIILSGLLFCGCAGTKVASTHHTAPAIDLVASGQDSIWGDGCILHVAKRDGSTLQDIQLTRKTEDGLVTVLTAKAGSVWRGSLEDANDDNAVKLILRNARIERNTPDGKTVGTADKVTLVLQRPS